MMNDWQKYYDEKFGNLGTFKEQEIDKIEQAALKHLQIKQFISKLLEEHIIKNMAKERLPEKEYEEFIKKFKLE